MKKKFYEWLQEKDYGYWFDLEKSFKLKDKNDVEISATKTMLIGYMFQYLLGNNDKNKIKDILDDIHAKTQLEFIYDINDLYDNLRVYCIDT